MHLATMRAAAASPTTAAMSAAMILAMAVSVAAAAAGPLSAAAEGSGGAYVESVTFTMQADPATAISNLKAGQLDMYYQSIPHSEAGGVREAGYDIYESAGGTTYSILANPTDDHTAGFNPFSLQGVRYALNYVVDRDGMVDDLPGAGSPALSAMTPQNPDYPLVFREMASLGIRHDLSLADRLISEALVQAGASRSGSGGKWHHGGSPIEITMFIRSDDPVRSSVGERIASDLEALGFVVERTYGNLYDAYFAVYGTDPAAQEWHLYTEAWSGQLAAYGDWVLAILYAPWVGAMPGASVPGAWQYQNSLLDGLTASIVFESYGTPEERAELARAANREGIRESVRVFLASERELYAVRDGITGVVHTQSHGIASRYTPINAQLPGGDASLEIGVRHVAQSAWNPVGGFGDTYSHNVWSLLRDTAHAHNPHNGDARDGRNVLVYAEGAGDDGTGMIDIPDGAVFWDTDTHTWSHPPAGTQAVAKVTFDLRFANWHHGRPMDLNDVLYPLWFNTEHGSLHGHEETFVADQRARIPGSWHTIAVNAVDGDTVEIYLDDTHVGIEDIAEEAAIWASTPWEIYAAMDMLVHTGQADWMSSDTRASTGNWLDMLDRSDADLIMAQLSEFRGSGYVPDFLYLDADPSYAGARYDAAISWIESRGHAVISNGPFYLDSLAMGSGEDAGTIVQATLNRFDDPTYPFKRGHWGDFVSGQRLAGDVQIGSIASDTGPDSRYGPAVRAASDLAIAHFNEYLELRGEKWRISAERLDDGADPDALLRHLVELDRRGVSLAVGPSDDAALSPDALSHANARGMTLVSCCTSLQSLAAAGDSLFRLLPDQRLHGQEIAGVMYDRYNVRHVIPVGSGDAWAGMLLDASRNAFERMGGGASDAILYADPGGGGGSAPVQVAAADLAAEVEDVIKQRGARSTAVLYVGNTESSEFLKAAASHGVLGDVQWFGYDQNTASQNIADDAEAAKFASLVGFTSVQPAVPGGLLNEEIRNHLRALSIAASPYASHAYDAVWVLGLSVLNAQSSASADVRAQITPTAMRYVGAAGSAELNENGDMLGTEYSTWRLVSGGWAEHDPAAGACR